MKNRRRFTAVAIFATLVVAGSLALAVVGSAGDSDEPAAGDVAATLEEESGEGHDLFFQGRQTPGEAILSGDLQAAFQQAQAIKKDTIRELPGLVNPEWSLAGPTNVGGRVSDIAPDPTQSGRVFVAVSTAGVWKSEDGGVTVSNTWPNSYPQSIGAVTVDQNGTVYVGTGEVNPGGGSLSYGADGLYKSTDHGATWQKLPFGGDVTTIGAIKVDPNNANRIFVASGGNLFIPGGTRGLYRSLDGGQTWTRVLNGLNDTTGATDIAVDPTNFNKMFVPMWDHQRQWLCRCYTGPGTGIYLTTDGGNTWTRLENNRITSFTPGDTIGFTSTSNNTTTAQARMGVTIAPSDPNRVYITTGNWNQVQNGAGGTQRGFRGFYRSNDGGATFQTMANANPGGDTVWTSKIHVDPANPDRLFIAGVNFRGSSNGGASWSNINNLHADHHAMAWDPTTPPGPNARVYEGNDGGFYRSTLNGNTNTWSEAGNEPWTQFYTVDVGEQNPERLVGGSQDNGCVRSWNAAGVVTGSWTSYGGCGDGEFTLIDPADQNYVYACSQFGSCSRSSNAGNNSSSLSTGTTSQRRNWETPLAFDPNDPNVMYYGGNILNRTATVRAPSPLNWQAISPSLSNPASGTDPSYPFGTLTAIAVAPTDPNVIYAGTDDAWLWGTTDLGVTWTRFTDPDLPNRWVTHLAIDPTNAKIVYVTYSGYKSGDNSAHVLRSKDGGANWTDISGNLPAAPSQDVVIDPDNRNRVFVASDVGVFTANVARANSGKGDVKWYQLGHGLPLAPVNDLRFHGPTRTLYAATYGRSIWKLEVVRDD